MKNLLLLLLIVSRLSIAGDPANEPVTSALFMDRSVPIANIVQGDGRGALRVICTNCSGGGGGGNTNIFDSAGNTITAVGGRLQVDAYQGTSPWVISGNTGRTWVLSSGSDSVSATVSNFPATQDVNINEITGNAPGVTNPLPVQISNGSSYVDPTQIRALTSSDQITIANPTLAVTQSGVWTTGRTWTLASGTDSVATVQGTSPWVVSGTVTANQGGAWTVTANAGTNLNTSALALSATQTDRTQRTQITDGTRDGTVKAASTAAVAADTSFVVAISPNTPLPSGSNVLGSLVANQSVNQTQINGVAVSTGSGTTGTGVQRVVLPTDQTAIPVSQSGSWTVNTVPPANASTNVTQFGGNNVVTGTGASGLGIPRVTVSNDSNVLATQSGTWTVQQGTPPWTQNLTQVGGSAVTLGTKTPANSIPVTQAEKETYTCASVAQTIGNGKSMISLQNATGSGVVIKVNKIWIINDQTTAVTGVIGQFNLFRFTTHTAGTLLTPQTFDTADTLSGNVTCRTGATLTGTAATPFFRWLWSTDEWGTGTLDVEGSDHASQNTRPHFDSTKEGKPITLRENQGLTINQNTNSTAGSFTTIFEFTEE